MSQFTFNAAIVIATYLGGFAVGGLWVYSAYGPHSFQHGPFEVSSITPDGAWDVSLSISANETCLCSSLSYSPRPADAARPENVE